MNNQEKLVTSKALGFAAAQLIEARRYRLTEFQPAKLKEILLIIRFYIERNLFAQFNMLTLTFKTRV